MGKSNDFQLYLSSEGVKEILESERETRALARSGQIEDFPAKLDLEDDGVNAGFVLRFVENLPAVAAKVSSAKDSLISKLPR